MLELGQTGDAAAPAGDLIKDVNEADFMAEVIEASKTVPVTDIVPGLKPSSDGVE